MKNISIILALLIIPLLSQASTVYGTVMADNGEPVFYANVILLTSADSNIVDIQNTDESGNYSFNNVDPGKYVIKFTYLGYEDLTTDVFELNEDSSVNLGTHQLDSSSIELDAVTVTAQKPLLEMKSDKIVMNVEGSVNASGTDVFTLLRKSPGVVVDNNENIFMQGKGGVQIYLDGKPSPLFGDDLVNYLKSLSSSEIESIEIISQPSAKYDAEGNAGIINIKFRKDKNLGTSGMASLSASQGIRSGQNGTVRLTNKSKALNTFGSLSYYSNEGNNPFELYRIQSGSLFDQNAEGNDENTSLNYRFGTDYSINKKHTVGFLYSGSSREGNTFQESNTLISKEFSSQIDSILSAQTATDWDRSNNNFNLNYKFDSGSGTNFNIDLDYAHYSNERMEDQPNTYLSSDRSEVLQVVNFANESPNDIKIATAKIDYEANVLDGKLSTGLKYSKVTTNNLFNFYNVIDGVKELDITRSNNFNYDERVSAAYMSFAQSKGLVNYTLGLRVEHTHSIGDLVAMVPQNNENVERKYLDFFPSFGLSYKHDDKNSFQLNFSRRLNRPSYADLNPFRARLDELTFEQGNPFLNPEYATSVQLSHSWNYKLTTSISYSHTSDLIARLTDIEDEKFAYITWRNVADQYSYSLNLSAPLPITPWWNSYTSLTGVRTQNKADFGEGKVIDLTVYTFNVYSQHNFSLKKGYSVELSGWYNSPSVWEGNFKSAAMYSLDFGIQKSFLSDKLNIKLSVSDILKSQRWKGESTFGEQYILAMGSWDSRRVRATATYSFGNSNVKSRKRKTGLESEEDRIKS